jgi:dGTPase
MNLAPYAAHDATSRGRAYKEPAPLYRGEFQRDRDRIIHCAAFRRLEYKTQVFVNHEGDLFRTRLTHSLEVAQIGRSVARALKLNEDLTEAIALAHDLGHTPFGHAGQEVLNACMREYGGFEHNLQSLRVVDVLEERYAEFPGLNLTFETREGILKHCSVKNAKRLGELGKRFIDRKQPGLEAQLANLADETAYNNHDIDDGLRYGLLDIDDLNQIELFAEQYTVVRSTYPKLAERRVVHETIRGMINHVVVDLIENSSACLRRSKVQSIDDVRNFGRLLINYSESVSRKMLELKPFFRKHLYNHTHVQKTTQSAKKIVEELFIKFIEEPNLLPTQYQERPGSDGVASRARIVADYMAGMTDRYAINEHARLFGSHGST